MKTRGRKKGVKLEPKACINDNLLNPFYIKVEDKSYTVMKEGDAMPHGYYTNLSYALKYITQAKISLGANKDFTLRDYILTFENNFNELIKTIKL